jgi:hypothetical protein
VAQAARDTEQVALERETLASGERVTASAVSTGFNTTRTSAEQLERESAQINSLMRASANDERLLMNPQLTARLDGNDDFAALRDKLVDDKRALGYTDAQIAELFPATTEGATESVLDGLLTNWSAGDQPFMAAIQQAIQDEFGLTRAADAGTLSAEWAQYQPGLRALVREMYNNTQDYLKANDILEIPAYRGMFFQTLPPGLNENLFDGVVHDASITLRAGASFTTDANVARQFATLANRDYELVMAARIPREIVLSVPQTGFGLYSQSEILVLGGERSVVSLGVTAADGTLTSDEITSLLTTQVDRQAVTDAAARDAAQSSR